MSSLLYGCETWKLATHVQRKQNNAVSKMLSGIAGQGVAEEARTPTANIFMNMRDRWLTWVGHILRMVEDSLVRKSTSELRRGKPKRNHLVISPTLTKRKL